ncbi:TlyA family RNA methyltransferase [Candidatus Berkelbacteria bacterium]|nr:TlyA family RNA methyltransferase [Candidatus Berkelbacteria bacterium]
MIVVLGRCWLLLAAPLFFIHNLWQANAMSQGKKRLDALLTEKRIANSLTEAQSLIIDGKVEIKGEVITKSGRLFPSDVPIKVIEGKKFVSRGGEKLEGALNEFGIDVTGKVCVDVGSSTGGFTDCLLRRGAKKVYAIDVGRGLLDWKLRQDPRVVLMEDKNVREVESLPETIDLVAIDVSFISLQAVLPIIAKWKLTLKNSIIGLVKPQFEASHKEASKGEGVITDKKIHTRVLNEITQLAKTLHFKFHKSIQSPILGKSGNVEFLVWLSI